MPIVRGQYAENLAPGLNMRTFNKYRERPEIYRLINNVKSSTRAYEEDFAQSGFGRRDAVGQRGFARTQRLHRVL